MRPEHVSLESKQDQETNRQRKKKKSNTCDTTNISTFPSASHADEASHQNYSREVLDKKENAGIETDAETDMKKRRSSLEKMCETNVEMAPEISEDVLEDLARNHSEVSTEILRKISHSYVDADHEKYLQKWGSLFESAEVCTKKMKQEPNSEDCSLKNTDPESKNNLLKRSFEEYKMPKDTTGAQINDQSLSHPRQGVSRHFQYSNNSDTYHLDQCLDSTELLCSGTIKSESYESHWDKVRENTSPNKYPRTEHSG
jgi:hypothetical protein